MRDGIRHRHDCLEPELAVLIRDQHAAAIWPVAVRVLHVIVAGGVGLPDVDGDAGDGGAAGVLDGADDETGLAKRVRRDAGAVGDGFGVVRVEGPEHGSFRARGGFGVVDGVDEKA